MSDHETGLQPASGGFSARRVLLASLPIVLIVVVIGGWYWRQASREEQERTDPGPYFRLAVDYPTKLDERFADADGDGVADAPSDAIMPIDPEVLVFAPLNADTAQDLENWKDFVAHLKEATGKKEVKLVSQRFARKEQFQALDNGEVHLFELSTGAVTPAVNLGGFVPVCVMADAQGRWGYQMEIIVPHDSPVQKLEDLRGKKVAFGNLYSHSSFKLLVVTLRDAGLLYERDYSWNYTGSQGASIQAVRKKECDAAGVASDYLRRQVADGRIGKNDYRTLMTSAQTFPPSCFGHAANLKPELAGRIRQAFLEFKWESTSLAKAYPDAQRFVPISFQKDWDPVRDVDARLRDIIREKP